MEAVRAGGGLVLAARVEQGADWTVRHLDLIAYGAADGERRWRLGKRYREPEPLHDEGGKTIVVGAADGGVVLDRATGRELARGTWSWTATAGGSPRTCPAGRWRSAAASPC